MKIDEINKLVERLGRCVGGKLADDVAEVVKAMHIEAEEAKAECQQAKERFSEEIDNARNACVNLERRVWELEMAIEDLKKSNTSTEQETQ